MMLFLRHLLFLICFGISARAQQITEETDGLIQKATELVSSNPQQVIKIAEHLLTNTTNDKASVYFLIADSYVSMGNYNKALEFAFKAKTFAAERNPELQLNIHFLISGILRHLKLEKQAEIYLSETDKLTANTTKNIQDFAKAKKWHEKALQELGNGKPEHALQWLEKAKANLDQMQSSESKMLSNQIFLTFGRAYTNLGNDQTAESYFNKSLFFFRQTNNNLAQAQTLTAIAKIHFRRKQHKMAIETLFKSLKIAESLQHIFLQQQINKQLALNYLALNDRKQYHFYNQKFLVLSDSETTLENESTNTAFNLITLEQENQRISEEKKYAKVFYASAGFLIVVLVLGLVLFFRNRSKQQRYSEIMAYLQRSSIVQEAEKAVEILKKEVPKNLIIPPETEQALLLKLKKFEASTKFTNREMSLALLSAQMDTNTKYLSEIINRHRHNNFNTYINKLRIGYIIEKMKSDPAYLNYKISYLAEESGFSSHSSFATVFKSITGIAPTHFIDFLNEEIRAKKEKNV